MGLSQSVGWLPSRWESFPEATAWACRNSSSSGSLGWRFTGNVPEGGVLLGRRAHTENPAVDPELASWAE